MRNLSSFGMGIKTLTAEEANDVDLGPLTKLKGTWESPKGKAIGWNVIAIPGPSATQGFTLEVIPYDETITFTPVVVAGNRGPFVNGVQQEQNLIGLMYEQIIHSVCDTDLCKKMGFGAGTEIHAERGIFLNITNLNSGFSMARLSTIPHGNSLLALGSSVQSIPANHDFIGKASTFPKPVPGGSALPLGYGEIQYFKQQFQGFDQLDPNSFLKTTLGNEKIIDMTTLFFSTDNKDSGILNIPFIKDHVNATSLNAIFWIENILANNENFLQLQYTQTIDLVFPATGSTQPVVWPHVTVNTLRKIAS